MWECGGSLGARLPLVGILQRLMGFGKERGDFGLQGAHLLPARADLFEQLRAAAANVLRRATRFEQLLQQSLHPRVIGHEQGLPCGPTSGCPCSASSVASLRL